MSIILGFDPLYKKFISSIPSSESRYLLAISGGLDSMALLSLFAQFKLNFAVCHINHNIRPESNFEQSELSAYCSKLNISFFTTQLDFLAKPEMMSIELWARNSRYSFLASIQNQYNFDWICTAHHFDDQIETLLQNLLRGCSITGLRGIHKKDLSRKLLRPFLNITREELAEYINQKNIPFWEDSSNKLNKYQRNTLRNSIIPQLKDFDININQLGSIAHSATQQLSQTQLFLNQFKNQFDLALNLSDSSFIISFKLIENYPNIIRMILSEHPIFKILSQSKNWLRIENLCQNLSQNYDFENFIRVKRNKTNLIFTQHTKLQS